MCFIQGDQYDVREVSADGGRPVRNLGRPVELANRYFEEGADEITFLNITGTAIVFSFKLIMFRRLWFDLEKDIKEAESWGGCAGFRDFPLDDLPMLKVLQQASKGVFVPLTVGGGIRGFVDASGKSYSALEVASAYFR